MLERMLAKVSTAEGRVERTIEEIRRHQQLQAQLRRDVHVRYILSIPILVVIVEVLCYLLKDDATFKGPNVSQFVGA